MKSEITVKDKVNMALQVNLEGYNFSSAEAMVTYVGLEANNIDFTDEKILFDIGAKAQAKLSMSLIDELIKEASKG